MDDGWKELTAATPVGDLLGGDVDVEFLYDDGTWAVSAASLKKIWENIIDGGTSYRYRKTPKPATTHKERMTKWWRIPGTNVWFKVIVYDGSYYYRVKTRPEDVRLYSAEDFNSFESADIPPEV